MTDNAANPAMDTQGPGKWLAGIVVALPEELATLSSHRAIQGQCFTLSRNIEVVYAGAGSENAENAAGLLLSRGANRLISWGCAAALLPQLKPGDLLIPEQVLSAQNQTFSADKQWLQAVRQHLPATLPVTGGTLLESRAIVAKGVEKQLIHNKTGAVALDMETAGIFRAAQKAGAPALAVRTVADPADMDLPLAVVHALNSEGRVEINKLLRFLLGHPWEIPALIRLGLHFRAAQNTLITVAKQLDDIVYF
ncbi:MAG: phosphorylase [Methylococcales bacterium]|nr:phosphorylase [Methylococcales bacterium]